ncbi:tRNA (N6-threonylcarbamoyladenosine(37)-N6)-methyltransferase TrmO [Chloroflexota bacterium]
MQISIEPIGYVANNIDSPVDSGWGQIESRIVLKEELASTLLGLGDFSHLIIVFWMYQAEYPSILQRRPQNRHDMPEVGLFAQRSKHRPNPIGITTVPVIKIIGHEIVVRGLDAIDTTPILDIKPYYSQYDRPAGVRVPEWVNRLMAGYF